MPANWIIYIPRTSQNAGEKDGGKPSLNVRAESWRAHVVGKLQDGGTKYTFHVLWRDDVFPTGLGTDDVVYVYGGHGLSNRDSITWPGEEANAITSAQLKDLLVGKLPTTFNGKLKIYSCHSGETGATAFGKLVADKMRSAGYVNCRCYGYIGEVTQAYEKITQLKAGIYKGQDFEDIKGVPHRFAMQNKFYMGRASAEGNRILL
jgi:hypothetical protein